MAPSTELSRGAGFGFGLLLVAVGIFCLYMGFWRDPPAKLNGPPWLGALACLVFVFAGLLTIVNGIANAPGGSMPASAPFGLRLAHHLLALAILLSFALTFSWVAFGPGERAFSVNGGAAASGRWSEIGGRVAFGIGAVLIWIATAWIGVFGFRRLAKPEG